MGLANKKKHPAYDRWKRSVWLNLGANQNARIYLKTTYHVINILRHKRGTAEAFLIFVFLSNKITSFNGLKVGKSLMNTALVI